MVVVNNPLLLAKRLRRRYERDLQAGLEEMEKAKRTNSPERYSQAFTKWNVARINLNLWFTTDDNAVGGLQGLVKDD